MSSQNPGVAAYPVPSGGARRSDGSPRGTRPDASDPSPNLVTIDPEDWWTPMTWMHAMSGTR